MAECTAVAITAHFKDLEDPRIDRTKRHRLSDIITIALCAVICGADSWVEVQKFGSAKLGWLRRRLELPNGIPSHDTFGRVFRLIDPQKFQDCFLAWIRGVSDTTEGRLIPIDGKTVRRSSDTAVGKSPLHLVSAWAAANHLLLGQVAVGDKTNEITAIPQLLDLLDLEGAIVSIDAMGCQKEIARKIVDGGGDYVLAVKANQDTLRDDVMAYIGECLDKDFAGVKVSTYTTAEAGHGRREERYVIAVPVPEGFRNRELWAGLESLCLVTRTREVGEQVEGPEAFYYISSLKANAKKLGAAVRGHWGIENGLHWVLDMSFREDESRVRKDHAPANLGLLRRLALSLLKRAKGVKGGVHAKRLQAGWDEKVLEEIMADF
jgi:predicted transposase YbfD/YdcC